ncbi:MAG: hypothetical protein HOK91_19740 [Gammaproteobacteria bacterium]|nr:hypothetical protein [Gammaproteobacteria bacterium]
MAVKATTVDDNRGQPDTDPQSPEAPQWKHPYPKYASELEDMVDDLMPLYVAFKGWVISDDNRRNLIVHIADALKEFKTAEALEIVSAIGLGLSGDLVDKWQRDGVLLSEDQMDDVVSGLEDYIGDFADYYGDAAGIKWVDIEDIESNSATDPLVEEFLKMPTKAYLTGVQSANASLDKEARQSALEARENNANAESQIMIVAGSIAVIVLFVLLLVLLKVENSLRRSADVAEGAVVNN